ncbi:MAG: methyltransferase domain-containing protein [Thermoleophilia bacterium]|nr:methyltransferase domain-containing protein [Thermoleophilia bacterium]
MVRTSLVGKHAVERLLLLVGAVRSGLVDALAGLEAASAAEVAQTAGLDRRATSIILEALAAQEIVERISEPADTTRYRLLPQGRAHLVDEGPDLERAGLLHQVNKVRGWLELHEVIRTGEPFSTWTTGSRDVRTRSLAMGEREPELLDEIVERCLAYGGRIETMIDVGGAVGHLARCFSRKGVKATLFDQEEVIPLATEYLGAEASDMALIAGDYTQSLPAGPFDLVYFGNVYHIYSPETNARVTREAFSMVSPGGVMAIQDYVWGRNVDAAMFAVNMLRSTVDGGVWTEQQHREWLSDAGFVDIEVVDLQTAPVQLVLARRPRGL